MKKKIAKLWTKALRSGEYPQTTDALRNKEGFCCMGVLCELAVKSGVIPEATHHTSDSYVYSYGGYTGVLPVKVMEWAGVKTYSGKFEWHPNGKQTCLTDMNDSGVSFNTIAATIEEYRKEL